MSNKPKNQTTRKKSNSKKKKNKFGKVLTIIVIILGVVWYISGKPTLIIDESSFEIAIVQTDTPIWERFSKPAETRQENLATQSESINQTETSVSDELEAPVKPAVSTEQQKPVATQTAKLNNITEHDLNHAENTGLYFGNPSDAVTSIQAEENYLLEKPQYTLSYNNKTLIPNWVAWHLDTSNIGEADRSDKFAPDTTLPDGWYRVKKADYQFSKYGFDRGHVCPSADRTTTIEDNEITFLMTNMVPQAPDCNRIVWKNLEEYERELALQGNEVYIFAGPSGIGGVSGTGTWEYITISQKKGDDLQMLVPEYTWKIILSIPKGTDDINRITENSTVIAVMVPNKQGVHKNATWENYTTTVDAIEEELGYDFFELIDDSVEEVLEARLVDSD